ncbi:hypothetical protein PANT111_10080 [Pantoea brenneri]|uniref:Uncharacterized protein n=1 Tax=Pantoea brenneri TaxID=472694 RepID=A0AAX3IZU5_9GAMM|nr:hypothetical protein PANT111_10080 [Pantoea brenneri]
MLICLQKYNIKCITNCDGFTPPAIALPDGKLARKARYYAAGKHHHALTYRSGFYQQ